MILQLLLMLITECGEPIDHPGYQAQRESTDEEDDGNCDEPEREPTKSVEQHHNRVHDFCGLIAGLTRVRW